MIRSGGKLSLRAAAVVVHSDAHWWIKALLYGASTLSLAGLPLAAGFIMESLDNSRKGFPTPLPPGTDWSTRSLAGIFALLIDFTFYALPLLVGSLLTLCVGVGLITAGAGNSPLLGSVILTISGLWVALNLFMFMASVAPAGRLRFAAEGRIEEALSLKTLHWTMRSPTRTIFLQARLVSLPAYLPFLLLGAIAFGLSRIMFPGQIAAVLVMIWLTLSALIYAHLIVVQVYVAAEKELQRQLVA